MPETMMRDPQLNMQIRDMYAGLTEEQRQCLITVVTQEFLTSFPYYSKVVVQFARAGNAPGPFQYVLARGTEIRAFSYAFNSGIATAAGFPAGYIARLCDTNLGKSEETISGESVEIHGIALQPVMGWCAEQALGANSVTDQLSDARALAAASDAISVNLQLNAGQQDYRLGIIPMLPGAGGLEGSGYDSLGEQAIQGGRGPFGYVTNGRPDQGNYFYMPEGIVWLPAGNRDSQLNVLFTVQRNIIVYSGGDLANNAIGVNETAEGGIRGYTFPETVGFALMVHLKGRTVSKRSMVT